MIGTAEYEHKTNNQKEKPHKEKKQHKERQITVEEWLAWLEAGKRGTVNE